MQDFSELGIEMPELDTFKGPKIHISEVLNTPVIIHAFRVKKSNFEGDRLDLQIEYKNELRILWLQAKYLTLMLEKVKKFPITATIIRPNNMQYEFKKKAND